MDKMDLIFKEYQNYTIQKENFIDRNFNTNRFYMCALFVILLALIYTNNIVFLNKISATLIFSLLGTSISMLWWMNVDAYNTLIKIKYASVIEKLEEALPVKPFTDEFEGISDFRKKRIFMFSDIQKLIAVGVALFFFAIAVSEATPIIMAILSRIVTRGGI